MFVIVYDMRLRHVRSGFTIVELLVVIVVIAILATLLTVIYMDSQLQARDTQVRNGAHKVAEALGVWAANNGGRFPAGGLSSTVAIAGGVCTDGATGFVGTGRYICTLEDVLVAANLLPAGFTAALPVNTQVSGGATNGTKSLAVYPCGTNTQVVFYALESPSQDDTNNFNTLVTQCGTASSVHDTMGMRGALLFKY